MLLLPPPFLVVLSDPFEALTALLAVLYVLSLSVLFLSAGQSAVLLFLQARGPKTEPVYGPVGENRPAVTIQVPVYNELYVAERCIRAVCAIDHPSDRLQIQVLDDSTDETRDVIAALVREYRSQGFDIEHVRRTDREGFKAGALKAGMQRARGEFIAVFDADFVPRKGFLRDTLPFFSDPAAAVVQTRWEHINRSDSLLTKVQAFVFDAHFGMEQRIRYASGHFLTFNGTGGIWRKKAIEDAGGWQDDTLTEDLDLSYRAQLRGWKLVYLNDVTSPAELPVDFNAFRMQQYRWTRGYIQTARKLLPVLWKSHVRTGRKLISTLHLTGNIAFPFALVAALLHAPVAALQSNGMLGDMMPVVSVFGLGLVSTFLYFLRSQHLLHTDWPGRLALFPLFLVGSMGLALSNAAAVIHGIREGQGTFDRTPKFGSNMQRAGWAKTRYASGSTGWFVSAEIPLALYCFFGVVFSLYQLNFLAVPFQLLFATGFSVVAWTSVKHARLVHRTRMKEI